MTQVGQVSVGLGLDDKEFNKKIKDAEKSTFKFAGTMKKALGMIGLGLSAKAVLDYVNKSVEAFRVQERAVKQLNQTLYNSGVYSEEYSRHLQNLASDLQKVSNYGDEVTLKAIAQGQALMGNVKITDDLIRATLDYAAATETDLNTAFTLVGKSVGTSTNALRRYGVVLDENMTKEQKAQRITQVFSQRYKGSAKNMADASVQLKNALGDLSEEIGNVFNPMLEATQKALAKVTIRITNMIKALREGARDLQGLSTKGLESQINAMKGMEEQYKKAIEHNKKYNLSNKSNEEQLLRYTKARLQLEKDLEKMRKEEDDKAKASKKDYVPIPDEEKSKKGKTKTDEYLENYQNFVEEFKQATNEYNATLQARKKVEAMGLTPLSEDYNKYLSALTDYELKVTEIKQANTYHREELLKSAEIQLQQELQKIALEKQDETAKKSWEIQKQILDAQLEIDDTHEAYKSAGGFLASFGAGFEERLRIEKDYLQKRRELWNTEFTSLEEKQEAFNQLEIFKTKQLADIQIDIWRQRGHEVQQIFQDTFSEMLVNYGDFSDNMRQLALNLTNYMIKQALEEAMKLISIEKMKQAAYMATGLIKKAFGGIAGLFMHSGGTVLPTSKHHYGGMEVPDQTEHFALLKNNERVLSPSETSAYNQNENNNPNYIVYAPQVRAMDSKDVADWFNENKNQIIGIISNGIRDNKQGLRTQIQGV